MDDKIVEQFYSSHAKTNTPQNMGLPEEWVKTPMPFVRTFRWTLIAPNHDKITIWVQKIDIDYKEKTIEICVYEDVDGNVHNWIMDMISDVASRSFSINHLDGTGNVLFTNTYSAVEVKNHKVEYDYSSSDVLTHKLKLNYHYLNRHVNKEKNCN